MKKESDNNYEFEKAWQKAFSDKIKIPNQTLWTEIESNLPEEKASWMRPLAWLFVGLAVVGGGLGVFLWSSQTTSKQHSQGDLLTAPITAESDKSIRRPSELEKVQKSDLDVSSSETTEYVSDNSENSSGKLNSSNLSNTRESSSSNIPPSLVIAHDKSSTNDMSKSIAVLEADNEQTTQREVREVSKYDVSDVSPVQPINMKETSTENLISAITPAVLPRLDADLELPKPAKHWLSVNLNIVQFDSHLQNRYQEYIMEYMQAHQHEVFGTDNFFEQSQELVRNTQGYQLGLEYGTQLGKNFYLQGGLSYRFWQYERQSNTFYQNSVDGTQHDFMTDMLKNNITNPSFIHALHAHDVYQEYLQGAAPRDLDLLQFNGDNEQATVRSRYHFLSLPVRLGYQKQFTQRLKLGFELGAALNYFLKNDNHSTSLHNLENFNRENRGDFASTHFNWSAGAVASYRLNPRTSATFGIEYQQLLRNMTDKHAYTRLKPESIGLRLGLRFHLR